MAITIALANRKGGSGKTTSTLNIAEGLARKDYRVLVIDADSQAQATTGSGVMPHRLDASIYQLLHLAAQNEPLRDAISNTIIREAQDFDLIPAQADLSALEIELSPVTGRESLMRSLVMEMEGDYDFILIDLPPSLGLITVNGLTAADWLLIPIELNFLSMDGLAQMMAVLYRINAQLNPALRLIGILPVKCDLRTNLARSVKDEVEKNFGLERILPLVRNDIRLAEAPSFGKTIFAYAPGCRGAADYLQVADAIIARSIRT